MAVGQKGLGKLMLLLTILYIIIATPWYLPKSTSVRIAGMPAWAFLVPFITCALGYIVTIVAYRLKVE